MLQRITTGTPLNISISTIPAIITVFLASCASLAMELTAVRFLGTYIGSSLLTWSTVIGVVLGGIAIGNYTGGRLADRHADTKVLGLIFWAAACFSLAILFGGHVNKITIEIHGTLRMFVLALSLFLAPSLLLGMVSPIVIKLNIRDIADAGKSVGLIYGASTVGSIVGVFLAGYVLIPTIGSRGSVFLFALILCSLGILYDKTWRLSRGSMVALFCFLSLLSVVLGAGLTVSECYRESQYYCIRTYWFNAEGRTINVLFLDRLAHGFTDNEDPGYLHYDYEQILATILDKNRELVERKNPSAEV